MTNNKINTKGFTLMEVLVSIAMVGILFTPMLTFFSHSTNTNVNAKNMQRVNTVGQSVMEEVRSYDTIADMVSVYQDTTNTDLVRTESDFKKKCTTAIKNADGTYANTKYYFVRNGLESDGKKYRAEITVDTDAYRHLNDKEVPVISSLGSGSTVMVAEIDETMNALYEYQSRYHAKTGNDISLETLAAKLTKKIKVDITDTTNSSGVEVSDGMVRVTNYDEYSMDGSIAGCEKKIQSAYLYNEEVVYEKLKGIYLFYNYDVYNTTTNIFQGIDINVNYEKHPDWKCDYGVYAVCQKVYSINSINTSYTGDEMDKFAEQYGSRSQITKKILIEGNNHSSDASMLSIFSNLNYAVNGDAKTKESMDNIVKNETIQRLAKVTVTIYDEDNKKCTTMTSTRGE